MEKSLLEESYIENQFFRWLSRRTYFKKFVRVIAYKILPIYYQFFSFEKNCQFNTPWAQDHFHNWNKIFEKMNFDSNNEIQYLEIGCYEGQSLVWMFNNILTHRKSRATVIDVLGPNYCLTFFRNLSASGHWKKVKLKPGLSKDILPQLPPNSFDIIYVDGSHSMADTLIDMTFCWPLLKTNGVMIIDDYLLGENALPVDLSPKLAVDTFLTAFGEYIEVITKANQVIFKKLRETKITGEIFFDLGHIKYDWYRKTLQWDEHPPIQLKPKDVTLIDNYVKDIPISYAHSSLPPQSVRDILKAYKEL